MAKILVTDDNRDAAETTALVLRAGGVHDVRVAFDGFEAVEASRRFHPDLVVMDIDMPGMDGHQAACILRREQRPDKRLVLIALTGLRRAEDVERAHRAGFDHHLAKPALGDALTLLVARCLGPESGDVRQDLALA